MDLANYVGVSSQVMARPRTINPKGATRNTSVVLSEQVHERLRKEADRRGVSIGQVIRERLAS